MLVFYIILVIPYLTYFCSLPCQIKWFNPTLLYAILKKSCSFFHPKISNFLTVPAFAVPYHFARRIPQIFYFRLAAMIHNIIYCIILFSLIEKYFFSFLPLKIIPLNSPALMPLLIQLNSFLLTQNGCIFNILGRTP